MDIVLVTESPPPNQLKGYSNDDGSMILKWERPPGYKVRVVVAYEGEIYSLPIPSGNERKNVHMEVRIENRLIVTKT